MEVVIDWSSSCGFASDTRKRMQQLVSEPSILGGERRLESQQSDAGITENRRELELQHSDSRWKLESQRSDARWEKNMQLLRNIISSKPSGEVAAADKESSRVEEEDQQVGIQWQKLEAQWRRMDAKFDALKKAILDLSVSSQGRLMEATDASSGSRESHVRAGAVHRSCSTDLDPTDCNLSPMQKTEEHKVKGIDSESYFLSFSHDSMNSFVGNSIGVSELSTIGDDSLIEQHSNIVEEESIMSVKDAIAIYEEEFVNSRNSSMKFDVAAKASFDVNAEGLVDKEEKEVSKEVSMGEFLCLCKGINGKYVQMDRTSDAFLFLDSIKVPMSSQMEMVKVPMTNKMMVQNPSKCGWLVPNWFAMPKVKMKTKEMELGDLIATSTQEFGEGIQLVDDASKFLSDKIIRVVVKVPAYLNDSQRIATEAVSSLSYGFERKTFTAKEVQVPEQDGKDNRDILILEIGILVGIEQLEQLGSLCNHYVCQGRFYIDGGLEQVEKWETLFVKVDHLLCYNFQPKPLWILVRIRFWTKTGPWLQSSLIRTFHLGCLHFALFLPTMTCFLPSLRTRKLIGGSIGTITIAWLMGGDEAYEVCWQCFTKELETGESALRRIETDIQMLADNSIDVLMRVLRWIQERSVARLLEASVRSNGQIRSEREAAGERERVLCLKRLSVVQSHYLSWEWLFAWFPRPMVKKVKRLVSVIPCGQGILRGMDCYGHKL